MPFRIKAFLIHLLISACVAACSLYVVFTIWHPDPMQKAVGVTRIFLFLLGIDVTIGPLLTLLIASDESKKTRRLNNMVTRIAQMDYMIFSAIKGRNEGNMIKNCYARGKFEGEEKKWNLDEYVNLNSRIAYSLEKNEAVVSNYYQAIIALEILKKKKK